MVAQPDSGITVRIVKDGWTLETRGGRVTIQDLGDGTALAGDWECDGTDPHAALRLYRAGLKLVSAMKFKELLIHTEFRDKRLYDFYTKLGWEPTHIIYRKKQNGRNSKHNL